MTRRTKKKIIRFIMIAAFIAAFVLYYASIEEPEFPFGDLPTDENTVSTIAEDSHTSGNVPDYGGDLVIQMNGGDPSFTKAEKELLSSHGYEYYSSLDSLGRCGYAESCVGPETMPEYGEKREGISSVYPSGWNQKSYSFVDQGYLWNRSHLIGWQLTGENANDHNLITGTRTFNAVGMLDYENEVASYVHKTGNHVMYRVTPLYKGDELVARGVQMQAESIETDDVNFNVFVFNVEPGVEIDYSDGSSHASGRS